MARKTEHATCHHSSGPVMMLRVYTRDKRVFRPVGWMCPDCRQMRADAQN